MTRKSHLLVVLFLVSALVVGAAGVAHACSCGPLNARNQLAEADGAFIGEFIELSYIQDPNWGTVAVLTYRVDEAFKGELGETVEIVSTLDNCGLTGEPGVVVGLFLHLREDGQWTSDSCSVVDPDELRAAAAPLPPPDGEGPTALLIGMDYGEVRSVALDRRGRTLAYGLGEGYVSDITTCPGSKRAVEAAYIDGSITLATRDLRTYELLREAEVPFSEVGGTNRYWASKIFCADRRAREVFVLLISDDYGSKIVRVGPRAASVIHRGDGVEGIFAGNKAYLVEGRESDGVSVVRLGSGARRRIASTDPGLTGLSLSPDGRLLAGFRDRGYYDTDDSEIPPQLMRINVASGRIRSTTVKRGFGTAWLSNKRIVFFSGKTHIFGRRLEKVSSVEGWVGWSPVLRGQRAYGLFDEEVRSLRLSGGPLISLRKLPSRVTTALIAVPAGD